MKEVKSNYNNVIDNDIYDIELNYKDQYTETINYELDVFNHLKKGKVTVNKYESNSNIKLANTLIEIRSMDDRVVYKGYTDHNGQIIVEDLPYGEYYIAEVEASTGYRVLDDNIYFTLDKDDVSIDIYNERIVVPNTGINIGIINVLILITIILFTIICIIFGDNKKIVLLCIFIIGACSIYLGRYFYRYFGDTAKNDKAVKDFI